MTVADVAAWAGLPEPKLGAKPCIGKRKEGRAVSEARLAFCKAETVADRFPSSPSPWEARGPGLACGPQQNNYYPLRALRRRRAAAAQGALRRIQTSSSNYATSKLPATFNCLIPTS